jgi:hypothetical protein
MTIPREGGGKTRRGGRGDNSCPRIRKSIFFSSSKEREGHSVTTPWIDSLFGSDLKTTTRRRNNISIFTCVMMLCSSYFSLLRVWHWFVWPMTLVMLVAEVERGGGEGEEHINNNITKYMLDSWAALDHQTGPAALDHQ